MINNKTHDGMYVRYYTTPNIAWVSGWSTTHTVVIDDGQAISWWRHQMETFSALLAICAGNSPAPVNSPPKGQWRGALMFSLICARINGWVNSGEACDLRRHRVHYYVIVILSPTEQFEFNITHWNYCKILRITINFELSGHLSTVWYAHVRWSYNPTKALAIILWVRC